jgi:hypothetical protein
MKRFQSAQIIIHLNYNSEATIDDGTCEFTQATLNEFIFTNCGQEGRFGPDQTQVNNEYVGTLLENQGNIK